MDLVRAILKDRKKFAGAIFSSSLPKEQKIQLLKLAKRSARELVNDVVAAWYKNQFNASPIRHEALEVPKEWLPKTRDPDVFQEWLTGIMREIIYLR